MQTHAVSHATLKEVLRMLRMPFRPMLASTLAVHAWCMPSLGPVAQLPQKPQILEIASFERSEIWNWAAGGRSTAEASGAAALRCPTRSRPSLGLVLSAADVHWDPCAEASTPPATSAGAGHAAEDAAASGQRAPSSGSRCRSFGSCLSRKDGVSLHCFDCHTSSLHSASRAYSWDSATPAELSSDTMGMSWLQTPGLAHLVDRECWLFDCVQKPEGLIVLTQLRRATDSLLLKASMCVCRYIHRSTYIICRDWCLRASKPYNPATHAMLINCKLCDSSQGFAMSFPSSPQTWSMYQNQGPNFNRPQSSGMFRDVQRNQWVAYHYDSSWLSSSHWPKKSWKTHSIDRWPKDKNRGLRRWQHLGIPRWLKHHPPIFIPKTCWDTLWLFDIVMENGSFIDEFWWCT